MHVVFNNQFSNYQIKSTKHNSQLMLCKFERPCKDFICLGKPNLNCACARAVVRTATG